MIHRPPMRFQQTVLDREAPDSRVQAAFSQTKPAVGAPAGYGAPRPLWGGERRRLRPRQPAAQRRRRRGAPRRPRSPVPPTWAPAAAGPPGSAPGASPPAARPARSVCPLTERASLTRELRSRRSSASSSSSTSPKTSCSRHRSAAGLSSSSTRRFRCRSRLSSSAAVTALGAARCPACGARWDERAAFRGVPPLPGRACFPGIVPALRSAFVRLRRSGGIPRAEEKRKRSRGAPLRMCQGVWLTAAAQPQGAGRSLRRLEPRDRHSRATSLALSPAAPPRVGVPLGRPIFRV